MSSPPAATSWAPTWRALRVRTEPVSASGRGSEDDRIGSDTSSAAVGPDWFVNNTEVGLDLEGASRTKVRGIRFGVLGGRAPNGTDIEISDALVGGRVVKATDNEIGAKKSRFAELSTGCSEGCNVIDAAVGDGIDLGGDGGVELPASGPTRSSATSSAPTGSGLSDEAALPNGDTAIAVGSAERVTIGGPLPKAKATSSSVAAGPLPPALKSKIGHRRQYRRASHLGISRAARTTERGRLLDLHVGIPELRDVALDRGQLRSRCAADSAFSTLAAMRRSSKTDLRHGHRHPRRRRTATIRPI